MLRLFRISWHRPAIPATVVPSISKASIRLRIGEIIFLSVDLASVPALTRCHRWKISSMAAPKPAPIRVASPPRSPLFLASRRTPSSARLLVCDTGGGHGCGHVQRGQGDSTRVGRACGHVLRRFRRGESGRGRGVVSGSSSGYRCDRRTHGVRPECRCRGWRRRSRRRFTRGERAPLLEGLPLRQEAGRRDHAHSSGPPGRSSLRTLRHEQGHDSDRFPGPPRHVRGAGYGRQPVFQRDLDPVS